LCEENLSHAVPPIRLAFLRRRLQNIISREYRPPILSLPVETNDKTVVNLTVHDGDDLYLAVQLFEIEHGLNLLPADLAKLHTYLQQEIPHHRSIGWVQARQENQKHILRDTPLNAVPLTLLSEHARQSAFVSSPGPGRCLFTLAMTTCRRLATFEHTLSSLEKIFGAPLSPFSGQYEDKQPPYETIATSNFQLPKILCGVVVIDDNSISEERAEMLQRWPQFTYIFKNSHQKGELHNYLTPLPSPQLKFTFLVN
jgi:hypothetical protein